MYEFLKIILFIYLFLAVVGLSCCGGFSLAVVSWGNARASHCVASLVAQCWL